MNTLTRENHSGDRAQTGRTEPGHRVLPRRVANETGQQVGFAVLQANHRVDLAIAEGRQAAEASA